MIHYPIPPHKQQCYASLYGHLSLPITEAIHNDVAYKDLLDQAKDEMTSFVTKYSQIEELNPVKAEMLKTINAL